MRMLAIVCLLVASVAQAAPRRIAMMAVTGGESVPAAAASMLTEAVAAELRRLPDVQVVTQSEISALLSHEQQKQLLGCADDSCTADLGGALGVDELVTGSIGRLGESWLVNLKRLDVKKATALKLANRRLRGGTIDDVLDVLPGLCAELFDAAPVAGQTTTVIAPQTPSFEAKAVPPGFVEKPAEVAAEARSRLVLLTDGKDGYVAYDPEQGSWDPFFAGDATHLWGQRVTGGGSDGEGNFDRVIWEPRVKSRWQGGFARKGGKFSLQCGDKAIGLTPVPADDAKKLLARATLYEPRWQRRAFAIARSDAGTYYYVDQAREPDDNADFRFFVGGKNKLAFQPLEDSIVDGEGQLFITASGRLHISRREKKAEWIVGTTKTPLVYLDLEDQAFFAYTALGVYKGENLGTACDGRF